MLKLGTIARTQNHQKAGLNRCFIKLTLNRNLECFVYWTALSTILCKINPQTRANTKAAESTCSAMSPWATSDTESAPLVFLHTPPLALDHDVHSDLDIK